MGIDEFDYYFDFHGLPANVKALGTFGYQVTARGNPRYERYMVPTAAYLPGYAERQEALRPAGGLSGAASTRRAEGPRNLRYFTRFFKNVPISAMATRASGTITPNIWKSWYMWSNTRTVASTPAFLARSTRRVESLIRISSFPTCTRMGGRAGQVGPHRREDRRLDRGRADEERHVAAYVFRVEPGVARPSGSGTTPRRS